MPTIHSQRDLRTARSLPFCYLCGSEFSSDEKPNREHVVPKAVFAPEDRNPPLILPSHPACNESLSTFEETIGQVVSVLHGIEPKTNRLQNALESFASKDNTEMRMALSDSEAPIVQVIWTWVRGFHAALYKEHLASDRMGSILPPFPSGRMIGNQVLFDEPRSDQLQFINELKKHRHLGKLDRVKICNDRCEYSCVWLQFDNGVPFCLFALQLYDWEKLGDLHSGPRRGCIGWYEAPTPTEATRGTKIMVPPLGKDPLDPFESI